MRPQAEREEVFIIGATNTLTIRGHHQVDQTPAVYPVNAVATLLEMLDPAGTPIAALTGLNLPYVAGTTGRKTAYRVVIPHDAITVAGWHTARIMVVHAGNYRPYNVRRMAKLSED